MRDRCKLRGTGIYQRFYTVPKPIRCPSADGTRVMQPYTMIQAAVCNSAACAHKYAFTGSLGDPSHRALGYLGGVNSMTAESDG
jgi:hypothetical protein